MRRLLGGLGAGNERKIVFVVRERRTPKFLNECKGCSLFTKHKVDYTNGAAKTTTLLIEKQMESDVIQVFRNPAYKE